MRHRLLSHCSRNAGVSIISTMLLISQTSFFIAKSAFVGFKLERTRIRVRSIIFWSVTGIKKLASLVASTRKVGLAFRPIIKA